MKKGISILVMLVLTLNLTFANYSSNKNAKSTEPVKISNVITSENTSQTISDFKANLKNLKTKITDIVKIAKGNIVEKIKKSNLSINKYIIIGLICILLGVVVGVVFGNLGYLLAVIGVVLIILGLIQYL